MATVEAMAAAKAQAVAAANAQAVDAAAQAAAAVHSLATPLMRRIVICLDTISLRRHSMKKAYITSKAG